MTGPDAFQAELDTRLGTSIKRAEQALMAAKTAALTPYGVTVSQYSALLMLSYAAEASAAQLSRACAVTPQSMATVVENLEAKGLVAREPSPLHGRVMAVRLTETGRALVNEADRAARAVEKSLLDAFTGVESSELRALLARAVDVLARR